MYFREIMLYFLIDMEPKAKKYVSKKKLAAANPVESVEPCEDENKIDIVSIPAMKGYCCKNSTFLSEDECETICRIMMQNGLKNLLIDSKEGCNLDLDKIVDETIIQQIYGVVRNKIDKLQSKSKSAHRNENQVDRQYS